MAIAYKNVREIAVNQDHLATVQVALVQAALNIVAEAADTPNHAARVALAYKVLQEPYAYATKMIWAIALTASATTDAAILSAVGAVWNAYAGS